jgi:UDP-N-acetylmuramoyl-tripeptide--D-alanyl-D-alanine ligase
VPRNGVVVVADDPPMLAERARQLHSQVRVAGLSEHADPALRGTNVTLDDEGRVRFDWSGSTVTLELRGRHNARNALVALGIAAAWGVPAAAAAAALAALPAPKLRSEIRHIGDLVIIADCYNANPASVGAAVDLLASMPRRGGRVAILGSMLELGPGSGELHQELAGVVARMDFDVIVATGEFADAFDPHRTALGSRLIMADDPLAAWEPLAGALRGNEVVLLKGSRGVALERLLPRFEEKWGPFHPHGEAFGSRAISTSTGSREDARSAERPQHVDPAEAPAEQRGE